MLVFYGFLYCLTRLSAAHYGPMDENRFLRVAALCGTRQVKVWAGWV